MKGYLTVLEKGPHNWSAFVPDLPGCVAAAEDKVKTEQLIHEAIVLHIKGLREDGIAVPEPLAEAAVVVVA